MGTWFATAQLKLQARPIWLSEEMSLQTLFKLVTGLPGNGLTDYQTMDKWTRVRVMVRVRGPVLPISPIVRCIIKCNPHWAATTTVHAIQLMNAEQCQVATDTCYQASWPLGPQVYLNRQLVSIPTIALLLCIHSLILGLKADTYFTFCRGSKAEKTYVMLLCTCASYSYIFS